MSKKLLLLSTLISAIVFTPIIYFFTDQMEYVQIVYGTEGEEEENEERPKQQMNPEEEALLLEYIESRQINSSSSRMLDDSMSSYADGLLSGKWSVKLPQTGWNGYRVDNSTYDSINNVFYVVSAAGHIYKLEYQPEVKWTLLNHKVVIRGDRAIFMGVHLADKSYRLLRSNEDQNRMEYSDDEGRTWSVASGVNVQLTTSSEAHTILDNGKPRIVLHTYSGGHNLYFSDDYGVSYQKSSLSLASSYDLRITKPYNSNDLYLWYWNKATRLITTYKYDFGIRDYKQVGTSTTPVEGVILENTISSYTNDGKKHFYVASVNNSSGYNIYYSTDGLSWTSKIQGKDRTFRTMVPTKPGILFTGFEDIQMSTNYGATWNGFGHFGGWWDLQHMKTYPKEDGGFITLAGLDFGCYVSDTPEIKDSYIWCNDGASYALHYDVASNEKHNSIYMGNQDRGTTAYRDTGEKVNTMDVDGTDVLRVAYSASGVGVWSWFYYGSIRHRYNFTTGKPETAIMHGLGNWWASPILPSPDPTEDAIYAAFGSNLQIFKYQASTNEILRSSHSFNFNSKYGSDIGGFAYSELDRNLWYVALNNGMLISSKDGGKTWNRDYVGQGPTVNTGEYQYQKNQITIRTSKLDTETVYYAGIGNMFMISKDGGKTFQNKNNGLNVYRFRDFTLSPDEQFVFAACSFGGAWVYSVKNDKWYQMNDDPVPTVDFTDVEFIEGKNLVRFASFGSGIYELTFDTNFGRIETPENLSVTIANAGRIELSWADRSSNEEGFYIERATDADFTRIGIAVDDSQSFVDTTAEFGQTYFYRIRSFNILGRSSHSNIVSITVPSEGVMSKSSWSLLDYSSEELVGEYSPAIRAIDDNPNTYWHTQWKDGEPAHPHYLVIDLGAPAVISGFGYLPRQDWTLIGSFKDYEFYVSNDTSAWGSPVSKGTFAADNTYKQVKMIFPSTGRYVKVVALSEIQGKAFASAAEIDVYYYKGLPDAAENLKAEVSAEGIELTWDDITPFEAGYSIEQKVNGEFVKIGSVGPSETHYSITEISPNTTYEFRVISYNYVGNSAPSNVAEVTTTVSGSSQVLKALKVYPNPVSDYLSISLADKGAGIIHLIDLNGRIVLKEDLLANTHSIQLNVQQIPSGLYVLEVTQNKKRFTTKVEVR